MSLVKLDDLAVVVCRPALPKDTEAVLELTSRIWEGHDYVPYAWADWLADPQGLLVVAEYGGRIVGLEKLSKTGGGDSDWWMQGLRVDPLLQGRGIASSLHDYLVEYCQRNIHGAVRLSTNSARLPVHHLCERTGFRRVGEFFSYVATATSGESPPFQPVEPAQAKEALEMLLQSPQLAWSWGMMNLFWQWGPPTLARLEWAIAQGAAQWWLSPAGEPRGLLISFKDDDEDTFYTFIQALACAEQHTADLLQDTRRLATSQGCQRSAWFAPAHPSALQAVQAAAFQRDSENSLYLYEKLMV